ncbi:hypothetical protein AVEN_235479-1 [Araneus ventricosus]|uniref:Uncharacterized protein n=1 Tax=Araneus ventricosus TaxID=182803 RepID=A0A4Y2A440_ARAVE|nr:hypothetical protein AVEN_235479-1 [Araneus ventricosus]
MVTKFETWIRVIALNYSTFTGTNLNWPTYSSYLTHCDYFLWGIWKYTPVFWNNPGTLHELEEFICGACAYFSVDTLQRATENFILSMLHLRATKIAHVESIVM